METVSQTLLIEKTPRQIRIATAVFFFISGLGYTTWASRIPSIKQSLHLNEAQLGVALLAMPIGLMATMPVTGYLLSKFSSNRIMIVGAVVYSLALALVGFTSMYWQFITILLFFGSSRNLFNLSVNTQSIGVQALYKKSIITTFHGVWGVAGFAGGILGYLMIKFDVPPTWHLLSVSIAMSLFAFYAISNTLHLKPVPQKQKPIFVLPDKALLKFALICFSSMACENVMYDWSGIYIQKVVHGTKVTAIAGFVVFMVAITVGRFIGDRLVNKWGVKYVIQNSGILIFIGFALAIAFPYVAPVIVGYALIGFGASCMVPLVYSMAGKSKSMSSGSAVAAISTVGYLGFLLVPPLVGFVAQAANLRWSFAFIALMGLAIVWLTSKIEKD